ncbi:hypothetical protein KKA15_01250 [Patescibacteria group bacterium]|nr:hypothetical protein [Patescibacteria group bacterium]
MCKKNISIILIGSLALIVILITIYFVSPNVKNKVTDLIQPNQQQVTNTKLIKEYEKNVEDVLKPYFQKQNFDNVIDDLLELTVPSDYQLLHLNLVIAFDLIQDGQKEIDQGKIEEGIAKINQMVTQYPWLNN